MTKKHALKAETNAMIKKSKEEHYHRLSKIAKENNDPAAYYKIINQLKDREAPNRFSVLDIYKGEDDASIAEKVANFFSDIG